MKQVLFVNKLNTNIYSNQKEEKNDINVKFITG